MTSPADFDREEARLQERLEANVTAAKAALEAATAEPTVKGSSGQPVAHPGFEAAARADEISLRLAAELRQLRERREVEAGRWALEPDHLR